MQSYLCGQVKWIGTWEVGDDGVVGGKVETEQQLTRRVREAKKNYVLQSRAHKIHSLSEQIYDATQMPSRLRLDKKEQHEEPEPERPEKLERALEMRRRSSILSVASMPDMGRRVSRDVQKYLEGRRFSLQSSLTRRRQLLELENGVMTQRGGGTTPKQTNCLTQPNMRRSATKLGMSIQEQSKQRLRRMSSSHEIPTPSPRPNLMNRDRVDLLACPRETLVLNVNDGAEFCRFTKSTLSRDRLKNIDRNHFMATYNFSLDDYDEKMAMVDPKHNRIRRKTASNEVSSENRKAREGVGSKKDDEDFGPGKRRGRLIEGLRTLEEAEYGYNIAKCHLWLAQLEGKGELKGQGQTETECAAGSIASDQERTN